MLSWSMLTITRHRLLKQMEAAAAGEPASDNSTSFGILTLVLAVVAFILLQVNSNLRKLTDEKKVFSVENLFRSIAIKLIWWQPYWYFWYRRIYDHQCCHRALEEWRTINQNSRSTTLTKYTPVLTRSVACTATAERRTANRQYSCRWMFVWTVTWRSKNTKAILS